MDLGVVPQCSVLVNVDMQSCFVATLQIAANGNSIVKSVNLAGKIPHWRESSSSPVVIRTPSEQ
jgi:hypothetical protein